MKNMHESCSCIRRCLCTLWFCRSGSIATGVCKKNKGSVKKNLFVFGDKNIDKRSTSHCAFTSWLECDVFLVHLRALKREKVFFTRVVQYKNCLNMSPGHRITDWRERKPHFLHLREKSGIWATRPTTPSDPTDPTGVLHVRTCRLICCTFKTIGTVQLQFGKPGHLQCLKRPTQVSLHVRPCSADVRTCARAVRTCARA